MAKSSKNGKTSQGLEAALWEAADKLRNNMDAAEYKHVVLGLIFLKYVSDVFMRRQNELAKLVQDPTTDYYMPSEAARQIILESRDEYTSEGVFWVPFGARWDDLRSAAKQDDIGARIDSAMDAIEKENLPLKGVLPKNYARREVTPETLGGLIDTFSREDLASAEHEDLDVLGRVFEYMVSKFASAEARDGGEFYTPRSIVQLMVEMIEPYNGRVYDPACGSGGMFVQASKFVTAHKGQRNDISIFGQEKSATTWRLAKMNMALRGIEANLGPQWGDTFGSDFHPDLKADYILANPPFNISDWGGERLRDDSRWKFGTPPAGNANFAWVQHMLHHLSPRGSMATVLGNGSLSAKDSGEGEIRRALVEADLVQCIVALPPQLFYSRPLPVCIWFLTKDKALAATGKVARKDRKNEVLFIDARRLGHMVSRTQRELDDSDIEKIARTFTSWRDVDSETEYLDEQGFCASVGIDVIRAHDFVLTPGRYVGSIELELDEEPTSAKISRLTEEIRIGFDDRAEIQSTIIAALAALENDFLDE
jgi:type I restriction enzyme M protein